VVEEIKIKRDTHRWGRMAAPEEMVGPTVPLASASASSFWVTGLDLTSMVVAGLQLSAGRTALGQNFVAV